MSGGLHIRYDLDVDALYLQLRLDDVVETREIEELVYLDMDKVGRPVGIEFVSGGDFLAFLQRHGDTYTIPAHVDA